MREALALLAREGLENSWKRHSSCRDKLIIGLEKLGLTTLAIDSKARLTCITAIEVPKGIDWKSVTGYAMSKLADRSIMLIFKVF